jgi:hypothetical protein
MDPDTAGASADEERHTGAVADGRGNPAPNVRATRHAPDNRSGILAW